MLSSPTSASYFKSFFFWIHLQAGLDVTTSCFNTYTVPTYHVKSEEDLLSQVMAAADVGIPGIGDRLYQNMVRRYRVFVEVAGRHIEPSLVLEREVKQCTVNNRSGRVHQVMCWYFFCSKEAICFRTWVPIQNVTILDPTTSPQSL